MTVADTTARRDDGRTFAIEKGSLGKYSMISIEEMAISIIHPISAPSTQPDSVVLEWKGWS